MASAEERIVSLSEIATTQTSVGKAEIEQMLLEWSEAANGNSEQFREILKSKIHDRVSPAVEGPNLWTGSKPTLYLCDGHHRASAVYRVLYSDWRTLPPQVQKLLPEAVQKEWRERQDLKIRLGVDQKYSSHKELVEAFRRGSVGQIPFEQEQLSKIQSLTLEQQIQLYRQMAPDLASLKDSPWRSAIGNAFFRLGINGNHFEHYIEFHVAEFLEKKYPELKSQLNDPLNKAFQAKIERILLKDPEVFALMNAKSKSGNVHLWTKNWLEKRSQLNPPKSCASKFSFLFGY